MSAGIIRAVMTIRRVETEFITAHTVTVSHQSYAIPCSPGHWDSVQDRVYYCTYCDRQSPVICNTGHSWALGQRAEPVYYCTYCDRQSPVICNTGQSWALGQRAELKGSFEHCELPVSCKLAKSARRLVSSWRLSNSLRLDLFWKGRLL